MKRTHRIYLDTWLMNSSIVGLYAILKHANKEHLIEFNTNKNYIDVDESFLDNFEEDYFNYFIDTYKDQLVYTKIIENIEVVLNATTDAIIENLENFNEEIAYIQNKVALNSTVTAFNLAEVKDKVPKVKKIKVTKKSNNIEEIKGQLKELENILKDSTVARFIKTENVIHLILNNFHANVGVLNKNVSKFNKFAVFNEYFIEPAEDYLNIGYTFRDETFTCSTCDNPINTKKEAFSLAWIKGIGVDVNRKTNYYYNFVNTTFICPVCNLILSCSPAGFYFDVATRKGIFINDNSSVASLIAANKGIGTDYNLSEFENNSYLNFANKIEGSDLDISCNIQIVKFNADIRTVYSFDLIDNEFLEMIHRNRNRLATLIDKKIKIENEFIDLYQASIDNLLRYRNTFSLFNILIQGKYYNSVILSIILSLSINGENTEKENYLTRKFQNHGAKLAKRLKNTDENKLHKLRTTTIKVLKSNDAFGFIELISFHTSYCGLEMLKEIVEILNNPTSFKLYGYSLLTGLYFEKKPETTEQKEELNNDKHTA